METTTLTFTIFYLLGYLIGVGYQYQAIKVYSDDKGILNRICGALILGSLSWIMIGIVVHNHNTNGKNNKNSG